MKAALSGAGAWTRAISQAQQHKGQIILVSQLPCLYLGLYFLFSAFFISYAHEQAGCIKAIA